MARNEEARDLALELTLPPDQAEQAGLALANLIENEYAQFLPKEVLKTVIADTLEAISMFHSLQPQRIAEIAEHLFAILCRLCFKSKEIRETIVSVAIEKGTFEHIVNTSCKIMRMEDHAWSNAYYGSCTFIVQLLRDMPSAYSQKICDLIFNKELFSIMFKQMLRLPVDVELLGKMLTHGDKEAFELTINEAKVILLLNGTRNRPGLIVRCMSLTTKTCLHNILVLIRLLSCSKTAHSFAIRKWFIKHDIFMLLFKCMDMKEDRIVRSCVSIIAALADSIRITDDLASLIVKKIVCNNILAMKDTQTEHSTISTLKILSSKRIELQRMLFDTRAFNYACFLIKKHSTMNNLNDTEDLDGESLTTAQKIVVDALVFCNQQLQLSISLEESGRRRRKSCELIYYHLTKLFFGPKFTSCLLNMLTSRITALRAYEVMVSGLTLPTNRFATVLFNTFDEMADTGSAIFRGITTNIDKSDRSNINFSVYFNYACHLIKTYSISKNVKDTVKNQKLLIASELCLLQLQTELSPEESHKMWTEEGSNMHMTRMFFDPVLASSLIKMLVNGSIELQIQSIKVLLAGLALPGNRFASILFNTINESNDEHLSVALFNTDTPNKELIQLTVDLLSRLFEDPELRVAITKLAKSNTNYLPYNLLVSPLMENESTHTESQLAFIYAEPILSADDLFIIPIENQRFMTPLMEFIVSNTFHFPLNILFHHSFQDEEDVIEKLLGVCKKMILDSEIIELWKQYRDKFRNLSSNGICKISLIAMEICNLIGSSNTDYDQVYLRNNHHEDC